jgi:hypothetical protein
MGPQSAHIDWRCSPNDVLGPWVPLSPPEGAPEKPLGIKTVEGSSPRLRWHLRGSLGSLGPIVTPLGNLSRSCEEARGNILRMEGLAAPWSGPDDFLAFQGPFETTRRSGAPFRSTKPRAKASGGLSDHARVTLYEQCVNQQLRATSTSLGGAFGLFG